MTAWLFTLADVETHRALGYALLCPSARYASVRWFSLPRPHRLFATPQMWRLLETELADTMPPAPLDPQHVIARFLVGGEPVSVQWLTRQAIDDSDPFVVATTLDGVLMRQPA